jgi:hypothetical protein
MISTTCCQPSAYQEARSTMGAESAAAVVACTFERGSHINSAGDLHVLMRRTANGNDPLTPAGDVRAGKSGWRYTSSQPAGATY